MTHLILPDDNRRPLPFYLAMEEVAARHFQDECFFTWIVSPTVIFGRNQVMENEVNLPYCKELGIQLVQRKSGGGCVYADEGNIMMSYITPTNGLPVAAVFSRYLMRTIGALSRLKTRDNQSDLGELGLIFSGHNDIMLSGKKISGSALYVTPDKRHAIAHGTLLHSTDIERMVEAITPSAEKLAKNGVQSVRQRVMNLSEVLEITIPNLRKHLAESLCDKEFVVTEEMIEEAEELMKEYFYVANR